MGYSAISLAYMKLATGAAACPHGTVISTASECFQAIAALGLTSITANWEGSRTDIPAGCSVRENPNPYRHFNSASSGAGRFDLAPICKQDALEGGVTEPCTDKAPNCGEEVARDGSCTNFPPEMFQHIQWLQDECRHTFGLCEA